MFNRPIVPDISTTTVLYNRKTIIEALSGILDCVNHGSVAVYDTPHDKSYFDGYRDAIKDLLVNFGEKQFDTQRS